MYADFFSEFLDSGDTMRVYAGGKLVFSSCKDRLLPLLDYIERFGSQHEDVVVFDKVMGNAAALLSIKAGCRQVYSPLGSHFAIMTLDEYGVGYHLDEVVAYIRQADGEDMCPMEKLSLGKGPDEFYEVMKGRINK
jgi:hypothetical protein